MRSKSEKGTFGSYLEDASNLKGGYAESVIIPETTEELAEVIREANRTKTPITISGGGTGTTGSRIPFGGIVVSMEAFNKIIDISKEKRYARAQSGVFVEELQKSCRASDLFYASHPTEVTATVGGTVSTNASGSRSFKYGPTRKYVRYLEMVLPTGEIISVNRGEYVITQERPFIKLPSGDTIKIPFPTYKVPVIKNSAGYYLRSGSDLIDLFIGQEGTLSVITEVGIELLPIPEKILSSFVFFKDEEDAWDFSGDVRKLSRARDDANTPAIRALSIEYFDKNAISMIRDKNKDVPTGAEAAIFFEQEIKTKIEYDTIDMWMELISRHGGSVDNTWVAMNESEARSFTDLRHHIPEAINDKVRRLGFQKLSTDTAVPEDEFYELMHFYRTTLSSCGIDHIVFGHIGECHLHVNLMPSSDEELAASRLIVRSIIEKAVSLGGTISAEHGVGKTRREYLPLMYGREGVREMARIKKALDPNSILGLDNIFPRELLSKV